ncbi:MAG: amidase [Actinobacteria bacterium]|nr:amidase [Actinomycetota bacterium]
MDLAVATATELVGMLRGGSLSSVDVVNAYLERIERMNPALNAVVTLDVEGARRDAARADAAHAAGALAGPLHGLPMTLKDSFETAGMLSTSGSRELESHVPERDGPTVGLLRAAGAVIMGKTNLPEYAGDWQTFNDLWGTTNNPWDLSRTPGGSSGGAAAALAAGMCAAELGSDVAGSIRVPAHFCGVYGHKPSWGIVPGRGHEPGPPGKLAKVDIGVLGPLARSAGDLDLLLSVVAAPETRDRTAWRLELPPPRHERASAFRVAAWLDDDECPVDSSVGDVLQGAVDALARAGADVDDRARPGFSLHETRVVFERLLAPVGALMTPARFTRIQALVAARPPADEGSESSVDRFRRAEVQSHWEWMEADEARARMGAQLAAFFSDYDVLLFPVAPVAAFPHDRRPERERTIEVDGRARDYIDLEVWMALAGLGHLPATVAPAGLTRDGLPAGIQIIGPYLEDRTTIACARALAGLIGGFHPPPPIPI